MCGLNAHYSADPDDVSAQIDLIGVPWLMIGEKPSAAPNGGYSRARKVGLRESAVLRSPLRPMIGPTSLHIHPSPLCANTSGHAADGVRLRRSRNEKY
jgi:hypothetical protein